MAQEYQTRGLRLTAVYSNCSGKHAGMLALARHHGWPTQFYTRHEHPVQQRCLAEVSRWTDVPVTDIKTAVDGCGVVCYGLPLTRMAMAYARLAIAEVGTRNAEQQRNLRDGNDPSGLFRVPTSAFRVVEAMLRHPELIAGEGRPCTVLMRAHPEMGLTLLDRAGQSSREVLAVLYHHERLDGTGYPYGLRSEGIPIEARILACSTVSAHMS